MLLNNIYPWGNNASLLCRALDDEKLLAEVFSGSERYPMRAVFYSVACDLKTQNILSPNISVPSKLADDQLAGPFLVQMLADPQTRDHMAAERRLFKSLAGIDASFAEALADTFKKWFDDPSYAHSAPAWSNCITRTPGQEKHVQFSLKAFENLIKSVDNPLKRTSYHRFMVLVATFCILEPDLSLQIVAAVLHKFPKVATWVAPYGASDADLADIIRQANDIVRPESSFAASLVPDAAPETSALIPDAPKAPAPGTTSTLTPASSPTDHSASDSGDLDQKLAEWAARAQETADALHRTADSLAKLHTPSDAVSLIQRLSQLHNDAKTLMDDAKAAAARLSMTGVSPTHPADLGELIIRIQKREQEFTAIARKHALATAMVDRVSHLTASNDADTKSLAPLLAQALDVRQTLAAKPTPENAKALDELLSPSHPLACVLLLLDHAAGRANTPLDDAQLDSCDTSVIENFGVAFQRKLHQGRFTFATPSTTPTPTKSRSAHLATTPA